MTMTSMNHVHVAAALTFFVLLPAACTPPDAQAPLDSAVTSNSVTSPPPQTPPGPDSAPAGCTSAETPPPPALAPGSAPRACTQIGCANGLEVEFQGAATRTPGKYTFTFELDGAKTTCRGALPLRPCSGEPSVMCEPSGGVGITESGCALPPAQHGFDGFRTSQTPSSVNITIERDGAIVATRSLKPCYRWSQPNGPGCEPICRGAREVVALP